MKTALGALVLSVGLAVVDPLGIAADRKPDFSGHWVLNVDKSNFGKAAKPTSMSLDVKQEGGVLKATQTTKDQEGSRSNESQWYDDGKEHPIPVGGGQGKERTHWEGNTMVTEIRSDDGKYQQAIRISASSDGKTATEKITTKNPDGNTSGTLVWERK